MKKAFFSKCFSFALLGVVPLMLLAGPAFAGTEVDDVLRTMVSTSDRIPGVLTGVAYLLGLIIAVTAVLKLKEHVLNPQQAPLRTPIIRFLAAGGLFALPMISQAVKNTFDGGTTSIFSPYSTFASMFSPLYTLTTLSGVASIGRSFNSVLDSILDSFQDAPGFISAGTYLLALILIVSGILKVKEHVENPEQTGMREGVIRLLVAGALLALPTIYQAAFSLIGAGGLIAGMGTFFSQATMFLSGYAQSGCTPFNPLNRDLGAVLCDSVGHTAGLHAFLAAIGYMLGLILAVWGVFKIKAHVLNPSQTPLHEGVTRFVAAGLFFALPALIEVGRGTITNVAMIGAGATPRTSFNGYSGACTSGGLDRVLYCMMLDVFGPLHIVLNFVSIVIGTILIMVGISRLMKSAQEGPKGPGGMGTIFTFLAGSALISYNPLMRAFSSSMGMTTFLGQSRTRAVIQYTKGMTTAEIDAAHTTFSAILKFMIIVGLISFVRGIYIIRNAAEGNQQSSVMAGVTHMVGGALAVNLGGLINAVQNTLGLTSYGIVFS